MTKTVTTVFSIVSYKLIYPSESAEMLFAATRLADELLAKTGISVNVSSDAVGVSGREILIGNTNRGTNGQSVLATHTAEYSTDADKNIYIIGEDSYNTHLGAVAFIDYVNEDGTLDDIFEPVTVENKEQGTKIKVLSFNVLGWTADQTNVTIGDTTYPTIDADLDRQLRAQSVLSTVLTENPDSFGVQEFNIEWIKLADYGGNGNWSYNGSETQTKPLNDVVLNMLSDYSAVGASNENPNYSYNAIFYRKDKWECLEYGTKWLSPTPNEPLSEFTGAYEDQSRMVTYAKLRNKTTGETYVHYNTHLTIDRTILDEQLGALKSIIDSTANGLPYVVTGDFNMDSNPAWSELTVARDNWYDARLYAAESSDRSENMIDYCFVSEGVYVQSFKNMTEIKTKAEFNAEQTHDSYYVSDHNPLYAEFYLY